MARRAVDVAIAQAKATEAKANEQGRLINPLTMGTIGVSRFGKANKAETIKEQDGDRTESIQFSFGTTF